MTAPTSKPIRDLEDFAGIASDWFWETDADHRFTYFSPRMEEVTHMRIKDILGRRRDQQMTLVGDGQCFKDHLDDLNNRRPFRNLEYRVSRQMAEGHLWLRVSGNPVFGPDGAFLGYRGTGHDVTEEKESIARLAAMNGALAARNHELDALRRELELAAFEDPLTGLRNRRAFDSAIAEALSVREPCVALLHIDLDRFKQVNDTFGHPAGDMVLVTAAARINALCGFSNEVFRIGGDEFTLLATECCDGRQAIQHGQDIVDAIAEPIMFGDDPLSIGASVGVALSGAVPTSPHRLIARADVALYTAKKEGRSCVRKAVA
ncbi:sensor domain-containing diguanylate cyclase [Octadecabacter sp. G9-8]|uniref:Sensor domain-containing diguanylate cyclase n=1 Tax=Octadecabacter dasysiphoniae TaxID=2909341 RepID=A0ABS9D0M1_9RHOB|nr:sensor domain-containing diguanylate cyclase [Octadecabacter dasysiphoniae]MCF2872983.1 sensor domain-containing diguanylate cyclase [Octadecabacter dasysiphoniae]